MAHIKPSPLEGTGVFVGVLFRFPFSLSFEFRLALQRE